MNSSSSYLMSMLWKSYDNGKKCYRQDYENMIKLFKKKKKKKLFIKSRDQNSILSKKLSRAICN